MYLLSLLHDITKREGAIDKTHTFERAFDAYYIAQKFEFTDEERRKLYTLAKHHEWLADVNTAPNTDELERRQKLVAFYLREDNLFELSLMFTHADLRAVNCDDSFHDTLGNTRVLKFDNTERSYGEAANFHATKIREYVKGLQETQPLLPVTKFPKASTIRDAITVVVDMNLAPFHLITIVQSTYVAMLKNMTSHS